MIRKAIIVVQTELKKKLRRSCMYGSGRNDAVTGLSEEQLDSEMEGG